MQVLVVVGDERVQGQAQLARGIKLKSCVQSGAPAPGYLNLVDKVVVHVDVAEQRDVVGNSRVAHPGYDAADTKSAAVVGRGAIVAIVETAWIGAGAHEKVVRALIFVVIG